MTFFKETDEQVKQYNSNINIYISDLVFIMPYVFGIDLVIIDKDAIIRTIGFPLPKKGIIYDNE